MMGELPRITSAPADHGNDDDGNADHGNDDDGNGGNCDDDGNGEDYATVPFKLLDYHRPPTLFLFQCNKNEKKSRTTSLVQLEYCTT